MTFMTFGFKHGTPRDADLTFDVRFLPNPHYESELRDLTGLDQAVIDYVESSDGIGGVLRAPHPAARLPAARPTSRRASRTSRSGSAARAAATARW